MFSAQYQHYFLHNNMKYTRIGVNCQDGGYIYTETPLPSNQKVTLPEAEQFCSGWLVFHSHPAISTYGQTR